MALRKLVVGGGAAAAAGLGAYGSLYERHHLEVTRTALPITGLPPALSGLRIALISDLHHGAFLSQEEIVAVARLVQHERPDLILLAGDYVTGSNRRAVPPCAEALSGLTAPFGVFAACGNHDPEATVKAVFESRGIEVLRDELTHVGVRGETIALAGLRFWTSTVADVERIVRGARGLRLLLAHDPRRLDQAAALGIPLVLSGHTHGGQVVVPGIGAPAAARFPVASGPARRDATTLYVTRGIGTVMIPLRVNCPPEIAILTLAPA
jgi:predicted MPP superfamily phosphohydrolase